jgi:hypothetical protein
MSRLCDMSSLIRFHLWILLCLDEVICQVLCLDYLTCLEFYFEVLLNMLEFYFELFLNMLEFYFKVLLNMYRLPYTLLMHVDVFSTLGQPWLASIQISWRGRPETAIIGLLLPRLAPFLLPHVARRWEALAAAAPLLLHLTTQVWRCGRCLLLLWHTWPTPPRPPRATMTSALKLERWAHMNTTSRFQLFSIITKCISSFSDLKVRKQISFRQKRTLADEEGQCRIDSLYQC